MTENSTEQAWDEAMGGGFFDEAGVDISNVANDPFGFGNGYHLIGVKEFRAPKVGDSGKFGSYIVFEHIEDRFKDLREFGQWYQLPTPKAIQDRTGIPFDPAKNPDDQKVAFTFKRLLWAFGFSVEEMGKANPASCQGRFFLAKLYAKEENAFWKVGFGTAGIKPLPEEGSEEYNAVMAIAAGGSAEGLDEFGGGNGGSRSGGAKSIEDAMREEIENA